MVTPHADRTNSNMLFANFNQDFRHVPPLLHEAPSSSNPLHCSCVSVGTRKGYSITNCDPFGRVFTSSLYAFSPNICLDSTHDADDGARGIVEMLFCTSLIALVGAADQPQSSPRKLQIVNTKVCAPVIT